ncbi:BTB domain-containing protein, partial [Favolaschia claudopus]
REEGLWFEDCGLIIRAENTIYRVSSAILAMHSVVFRDMLSLPPPDEPDMMDGCPLVLLTDSAEDVTNFLKAIFHYSFFNPPPAPTTFPIICSVLRMSHKYEVDELRKRALVHFSQAHPTTLSEWDTVVNDPPSWTNLDDEKNILSISIARQFGATWILPTAFYRMCQSTQEDNIIDTVYLDTSDKVRFLQGLRYLETTGASQMLDFLLDESLWSNLNCHETLEAEQRVCIGSREDDEWRHQIRSDLEERKGFDARVGAVMPLELWQHDHWSDLPACDDCTEEIQSALQEARQKLWNELPTIFGLPNWKKLRKMKTDALK